MGRLIFFRRKDFSDSDDDEWQVDEGSHGGEEGGGIVEAEEIEVLGAARVKGDAVVTQARISHFLMKNGKKKKR